MVCLSVCLSVTLVSPAKTAEPIEMPSGLRTWLGPRDHVFNMDELMMKSLIKSQIKFVVHMNADFNAIDRHVRV